MALRSEAGEVFVIEEDERIVWRAMRGRGRGFQLRSEDEQRRQVQASVMYGQWLRAEAERASLPVLAARPLETLVERIVTTLNKD